MSYSVVLLLVQCLRQSFVAADGNYECGNHGRFEYCIDEIPGCIIGCHCHPGYYFDTDTKICEPNSKLLQHLRRQNVGEPTRVLKLDATSDAANETETTAPVNNVNGHLNEITKDADDLGDWLYNQFFKTIESQVVNNTNDKDVLTRRSSSDYKTKNPKRTNKWRKRAKTYKRSRNERLKDKLLRVTENDSLFSFASSSSSDSSDSSSSDSSEELRINRHDGDDEHGHKKIILINKKPKPPLPNFIFLPNLDTSYYPPIGLPPPPPILPMYPMVPVPPVVPLFHLPVPDKSETTSICNKDITTATAAATTTAPGLTSEAPRTEITTSSEPITNSELTSTVPPENKDDVKALRLMHQSAERNCCNAKLLQRERKRKDARQRNKNYGTELGIRNWKPSGRQRILQQLKGKINKIPKFVPVSKDQTKVIKTPFISQDEDDRYHVPLLDNNIPGHINNEIQYNPLQEEISSQPENVDFKYITELIHRVDLKNKTDHLPPIEYNPLDSIEVYRPSKSNQNNYYRYYNSPINTFDGRRTNQQIEQQQVNDLYYTNLGRQIATLIRGIDSQNDQMKVEMERTSQKLNSDPYFNANSQKSFWERSVRSPLTFLNANKNKFEYLKKSNEILFNIENKVQIMASTVPALSLQEIENIVKVMETAKIDIQGKTTNIKNAVPSNKNLNINLWPPEVKILKKNKQEEPMKKNINKNRNDLINKNYQEDNAHKIPVHNAHKYKTWHNPHSIENNKHMRPFAAIKQPTTTKKPAAGNTYFVNDPLNYNQVRYGVVNERQPKPSPLLQKPKPHPLLQNEMNPLFLRHRKYFQDNNNVVFNQNVNMSHLQSFLTQPSYFHHQTNHFDYLL